MVNTFVEIRDIFHNRGHNGKVKSLSWSTNDALLTTAGSDGAVYQWKLKNFKRAKENVLKVDLSRLHSPTLFEICAL